MEGIEVDDILSRIFIKDRLPSGWQQVVLESVRAGEGIVYVLKLEDNKFYVGWTGDILRRIEEHWDGRGAKWTQEPWCCV